MRTVGHVTVTALAAVAALAIPSGALADTGGESATSSPVLAAALAGVVVAALVGTAVYRRLAGPALRSLPSRSTPELTPAAPTTPDQMQEAEVVDTPDDQGDPSSAPPGWYPDPSGADTLRYFNGTDWTRDVRSPGFAQTG